MINHKQWINWKAVPQENGKTTKIPVNAQGYTINSQDPTNWLTYDQAVANGQPLGFVLTSNDPYYFIDIDNAYVDGQWSESAQRLCREFQGAGVEVSQSNTGLHIIGRGSPTVPTEQRRKKSIDETFDLYTEGRFVAIARPLDQWQGDVNFETPQHIIDSLVEKYLPPPITEVVGEVIGWTNTHVEGAFPIEDDRALIDKAMISESVASLFGGDNLTFRDLWECNVPALSNAFPDDQGIRPYDASRADSSLAQRLAFWTGNNCERIARLMNLSALKRDKWIKRPEYIERTVLGAVARQDKFYDVGKPVPIAPPTEEAIQREGFQFMGVTQQHEYFKNFIYVTDEHRIFNKSNGKWLKTEQFNSTYGGWVFTLDDTGEKTTKKAWEAFTESQHTAFPKVDSFAFRPLVPPGSIIEEEGVRLINTYIPVEVEMYEGDVTPFLTHLSKLFPDERDRMIITSYMASCVQYPGYKIQWAPLIQGCEGNGKTLFTRCVAHAVGSRYTHLPPASEIGEKFNAWLFDKLFIGVEDIYVPQQKLEVLEVLKPMITSNRLARRAMQQDQSMHDVCANFMFNSNHKDAIRKTQNDRRFAVFYTPQQHSTDLKRDGMDGDYFPKLYDWLRDRGGYAQVAYYLAHYQIPNEFNPTKGCQRAPITSSTNEAVHASMGSVEQEIMNRIEEHSVGFRNGWVSGTFLDALLKELRAETRITIGKRRSMMQSLGYDWHPALNAGRVNNPILTDGGKKSKLFIRTDSPHWTIDKACDVAKQYEEDQMV